MISKANKTKIHIAKGQLKLTDDDYRATLFNLTGKESSTKISDRQAEKVLEHFKTLGWVPKGKGGSQWTPSPDPQTRMIFWLWGQLYKAGKIKTQSIASLRKYVKRMTEKDDPQWLSKDEKRAVIEALKQWLDRA